MDNSVGVCFLEWVATNPTAKKKEAMLAMKYMIEFMGIRAKELDYGMMLTSASENIVKAYKFCGFVDPKSPAHYHLFKPL